MRRSSLAVLLSLAGACGSPSESSITTPGIHVRAGAPAADTVTAEFIQALVVAIVPGGSGTVVRFEAQAGVDVPFVQVSSLGGTGFQDLATDTTDAAGTAGVRIKLGTRAGLARLRIVVPELGYLDSVAYTVLPGAAGGLRLMPRDTSLRVGASFTVRGGVTDRFGNDRADPVTLTVETPPLSIAGRVVTAQQSGRGRIIGAIGNVRDTVFAGIVPDGVLSAVFDGLIVFATDGSGLTKIASGLQAGWGADWSPNGQLVAFDAASGGGLRVLGLNGVFRNITLGTGWELYPKFSADGQWLYYSSNNGFWQIRRVHLDGSGDEQIQTQVEAVAPAPSPDGTRIAYVVPGPDELRVMNLASGNFVSLSNGHTPGWSPDGNWIAFNATGLGREIYVSTPTGAGKRRVSPQGVPYALGLDWSPDGRWIVARSELGTIDVIDVAGGSAMSLPFSHGWGSPAWKQ